MAAFIGNSVCTEHFLVFVIYFFILTDWRACGWKLRQVQKCLAYFSLLWLFFLWWVLAPVTLCCTVACKCQPERIFSLISISLFWTNGPGPSNLHAAPCQRQSTKMWRTSRQSNFAMALCCLYGSVLWMIALSPAVGMCHSRDSSGSLWALYFLCMGSHLQSECRTSAAAFPPSLNLSVPSYKMCWTCRLHLVNLNEMSSPNSYRTKF